MTQIRKFLKCHHEEVERWSLKCFVHNNKCSLVDALEPIVYSFQNGQFWKQFKGNKKKYPLLNNYRDEKYYKALADISELSA